MARREHAAKQKVTKFKKGRTVPCSPSTGHCLDVAFPHFWCSVSGIMQQPPMISCASKPAILWHYLIEMDLWTVVLKSEFGEIST